MKHFRITPSTSDSLRFTSGNQAIEICMYELKNVTKLKIRELVKVTKLTQLAITFATALLEEFITPIAKTSKGNDSFSFYSFPEFEKWNTQLSTQLGEDRGEVRCFRGFSESRVSILYRILCFIII